MSRDVTVTFRPLTHWPQGRQRTEPYSHEDAKFRNTGRRDGLGNYVASERTPLSQTLRELSRELDMIGVAACVVQVDVAAEKELRRSEIRNVRSPAVVVSFTRGKAPLTFAADYFKRWEDNLRAIVLGLEGLRRLERYHIAQAGDQYRGWQALPATTTTALSTEAAAQVLAKRSDGFAADDILGVRDAARDAYRSAASRAHPDRGGSTHDFQLVQEAKRVLEAHFGATL